MAAANLVAGCDCVGVIPVVEQRDRMVAVPIPEYNSHPGFVGPAWSTQLSLTQARALRGIRTVDVALLSRVVLHAPSGGDQRAIPATLRRAGIDCDTAYRDCG